MVNNLEVVLEREYGIRGPVREIRGITANQVFHLDDQYFIKVSPQERFESKEAYAARVELVPLLREAGIKVPALVPTKNGAYFVEDDRWYVEVHHFLPDIEFFTNTPGQIEAIAQNMAKFHQTTDALSATFLSRFQNIRCLFLPKESDDVDGLLRDYEEQLHTLPGHLQPFLARALPVLRERYQDIVAYHSDPTLNKGIVHGDLHDQQTLFHTLTKQLVALIDWEGAHWRERAYDIGYTLERISTDPAPGAIYDPAFSFSELSYDPRKIESFLREYTTVRKLTEKDLATMTSELLVECVNRDLLFLDKIFTAVSEGKPDFDFQKYAIYLRVMSVERLAKLQEYLQ